MCSDSILYASRLSSSYHTENDSLASLYGAIIYREIYRIRTTASECLQPQSAEIVATTLTRERSAPVYGSIKISVPLNFANIKFSHAARITACEAVGKCEDI